MMSGKTRKVVLNLTKDQAAGFLDWLANDTYWGHALADFDLAHGAERTDFVINGHILSNYSNQHHHLIIEGCYCPADNIGTVVAGGKKYSPLEYCLSKLGFA